MSRFTVLSIKLWVFFYSVVFFMRKRITYGRIGNRVEIYARERGDYHKFGVVTELKVIHL